MMGRKIINFIELWSIAGSGGLEIWVSAISFWKSNICWPQQPPTERYPISVKNWNFEYPFNKKGLVLVIWVPGMIQPSGSINVLMNWGCWGHWGHWCWWVYWDCRGSKARKITTEVKKVLQVFEFSFILIFWRKKIFLVESWNIILNFGTFSVRDC